VSRPKIPIVSGRGRGTVICVLKWGHDMRKPVAFSTIIILCFMTLLCSDRVALGLSGSTGDSEEFPGRVEQKPDPRPGPELKPERETVPEVRRPQRSISVDRCSMMQYPDRCRCALRTGGYIYPDPRSPSGYRAWAPSQAAVLSCLGGRW
jgi:hypothetical protein